MSLFDEIQASVLDEGTGLASVLLKLRLLASRLDSEPLAAWVRLELEGYDTDLVPPYRFSKFAYRGTFSDPFGSQIKNAPLPSVLIDSVVGEGWTRREMKDSISSIEQLAKSQEWLRIDASNLIVALEGKVYDGYVCNDVIGIAPTSDLVSPNESSRSY